MASCMIPTLKDNILFLAQSSCFPKKPVRFHKTYMVKQHQWFIFALRSEPCPHEIMRLSAQAGARRIQHSHAEMLRFIIITLIDKVSRSMVSRLHHAADGLGVRPRSVSKWSKELQVQSQDSLSSSTLIMRNYTCPKSFLDDIQQDLVNFVFVAECWRDRENARESSCCHLQGWSNQASFQQEDIVFVYDVRFTLSPQEQPIFSNRNIFRDMGNRI